ncbi:MAG: type II secretion system F family protein [Anaerolineaceae bacterium]|nr:MAG: type II secretion system F family protein [Anaerolineaceae bacterium]
MITGFSSILLIGFFVLLAFGLFFWGMTRALATGDGMQERIHTYALVPKDKPSRGRGRRRALLARLRIRLNAMLSPLSSEKISLQLMQANLRISVTEFLLMRIWISLVGLLVGWITSGTMISGIGLAMIAYLIPEIYLRRRISRRQIQFEKQLVDVLVLINGAVRAGFSLLQAIEVVAREMKPPASDEFKRVVHEVGLGLALPQALINLAERMRNADLDLMVTSIEIHYRVGGNLATMLSAVTETIRERTRLFGEVRVITTQQRYTGYLLSVLPFIVGALMFMMNPEYMKRLFIPGPLLCIPFGAIVGIILGHLVIQRIARIEV